jgi:hypothetical protein
MSETMKSLDDAEHEHHGHWHYPDDRQPTPQEYEEDLTTDEDFLKVGPIFAANYLSNRSKNINGSVNPNEITNKLLDIFCKRNINDEAQKHFGNIAAWAYVEHRDGKNKIPQKDESLALHDDLKGKQIKLESRPLQSNKAFIKAMFEANLQSPNIYFENITTTAMPSQQDKEMTLDKFLEKVTPSSLFHMILQVASPNVDPNKIKLGVKISDDKDNTIRRAVLECPYNDKNYDIVQKLFSTNY